MEVYYIMRATIRQDNTVSAPVETRYSENEAWGYLIQAQIHLVIWGLCSLREAETLPLNRSIQAVSLR